MKIALLTYFHALSYGATLQTYATIKALESLGHEVWIINLYIPETASLPKRLLLLPKEYKHWKFRKKYFKHVTRHYASSEELSNNPPNADLYMIGSDQTWNPDISMDKAPSFFLDFVKDNKKKVTYAASFGKDVIEGNKWISRERIVELIRQFDRISIRENTGKKILSEQGIDSIQVIDPVLLFSKYDELVGTPKQSEKLVLFKLHKNAAFYDKVREIGRLGHIAIRSLGTMHCEAGMECHYPEGIEGWMQGIASSKYMLTDSFHGTVLSLLYHRQFVVVIGMEKRATRLRSLLQLVGLEKRIMSQNDKAEDILKMMQTPINYNKVDAILVKERERCFEYLKGLGK